MNVDQMLGIIRHVLTFGGGYLVAKGIVDEATMLNVVGAAVTIVGAVWSIVQKKAA